MALDQSLPDMHRRLERHRRADGVLQSRARPVSHKRDEQRKAIHLDVREKGKDDGIADKVIRDVVDRADSINGGIVQMTKRLLPLLGGDNDNGNSRNSGNSNSGQSSTGSNSNSAGQYSSNSQSNGASDNGSQTGNSGSSTSSSGSKDAGNNRAESTSSNTGSTQKSTNPSSSSSSTANPYSGTSSNTGTDPSSSTDSTSSSSQDKSSSQGLLGGLLNPSSSSSTMDPTSTSSSSMEPTPTMPSTSTSASATMEPSTSIAYVTSSSQPSQAAALASTPASKAKSNDDNGPGAGPIIGIVAGSLAGVAVLAVIAGFLIKKLGKRKDDPFETNPFGHQDIYRSSSIPDGFDGDEKYAPSMSELQKPHEYMGEGGYGVANEFHSVSPAARGYSFESGRPRPPTMFQRHMNHQVNYAGAEGMPPMPPMPEHDFSAYGHGVNYEQTNVSPPLPPTAFMGPPGYEQHQHYGQLQRSHSGNSQFHQGFAPGAYANLDRGASLSNSSSSSDGRHSQGQQLRNDGPPVLPALDCQAAEAHATAGRPLSLEHRSGTPDLPNVQQTWATLSGEPNGTPQHEKQPIAMAPHAYAYGDANDQMHAEQHQYAVGQRTQPLQVRNLLPQQRDGHRGPAMHDQPQGSSDSAYAGYM